MNTFLLTISTPAGNCFSQQVESLSLRGSEGDLAVMAGHVPFVTAVKAGRCVIVTNEGDERYAHTEGGLLTVGKEQTTLLSDSFQWDESSK